MEIADENEVLTYSNKSIENNLDVNLNEMYIGTLRGIFLIMRKADTVEIIDFNSEAKSDLAKEQHYRRYQKQLETYTHIVEERPGISGIQDVSLLHGQRKWQSLHHL